ncbi:MAG: CHAD domain-containing protein [Pseudomonadota bacterium]
MSIHPSQFAVPRQLSINKLKTKLRESILFKEEPPQTVNRIYYDTFDWRLHDEGETLEQEPKGQDSVYYLRELESGELRFTQRMNRVPEFVWNIPPTSMRKYLEPVLEMRALLPQANINSRIHRLNALDKRRKTVARVVIEDSSVILPNKKKRRLGRLIKVLPVRGYEKASERILELIEKDLSLPPVKDNLILTAFSILGHQPGSYTSKLNLHLDPEMRSDEATKVVLQRLLDTMLANEEGTKKDIDSEFLHDFRVSVRRTRSALSQIKGVFTENVLNRFKTEFAWIGQITGPTRDMDVYLLSFDDYRDSLPAAVRADLDPLRSFLQAHQRIEQRALAKALMSSRYQRLLKSWRTFLAAPVPKRSRLPNANRPIARVARERTWRLYRRALKEGKAIKPETPAVALHDLRKTCKKLRYLMEFFQSLYPPSDIKALIKVLKILQDNLGDFQDYEVQVATLKTFSQQMLKEGKTPAETLMAMGILVESITERQHQARREFAERFHRFSLPENQKHFRALFAEQPLEALAS